MGGGRSMCSESDAEIAQQVEAFGKKVTSLEEKFDDFQESIRGSKGVIEKNLENQQQSHDEIVRVVDKALFKFGAAFR